MSDHSRANPSSGGGADGAKGSSAARLPPELLQHIFSLYANGEKVAPWEHEGDSMLHWDRRLEPLLSLRDRLRCQAVCRAWREALQPSAAWPIWHCTLAARSAAAGDVPGAEWAARTQPAIRSLDLAIEIKPRQNATTVSALHTTLLSVQRQALRELALAGEGFSMAPRLWPALRLFPRLRRLVLDTGLPDSIPVLGAGTLVTLPPTLRELTVLKCQRVEVVGEGLLPGVTRLRVGYGQWLVVDAALPRLRVLEAEQMSVQLVGSRLQLPRLTRLDIDCGVNTEDVALRVDFASLPSLWQLGLLGVVRLEGPDPNIQALQHLTSLHVAFWEQKRQRVAAALLQRARPSLRCLEVADFEHESGDDEVAAALRHVTQLTRLECETTRIIPHLAR